MKTLRLAQASRCGWWDGYGFPAPQTNEQAWGMWNLVFEPKAGTTIPTLKLASTKAREGDVVKMPYLGYLGAGGNRSTKRKPMLSRGEWTVAASLGATLAIALDANKIPDGAGCPVLDKSGDVVSVFHSAALDARDTSKHIGMCHTLRDLQGALQLAKIEPTKP